VNPEALELETPIYWEPMTSDLETRSTIAIGQREVYAQKKDYMFLWEIEFSRRFRPANLEV
jgi:hypothetical protein